MSGIFGLLGVSDTDRVMLNTIGQGILYDAIGNLMGQYNADLAKAKSVFLERTSADYKLRYKLPGGGRLQRISGLTPSAEVKATGQWDVAFPLEGFGAAVGAGRIEYAYMTVQDLNRHLDTVMIQDMNTYRYEMLAAMFNDAQGTFVDPLYGSLAIEPFANADSVVYPPVLGSEAEATEDHYYVTGYVESAISNTNNPCATIRAELEEHFGTPQGGSNIAVFINPSARPYVEALGDFVEVPDNFVMIPTTQADLRGYPNVPGVVIGRCSGCWVIEWRWIPTGYILGLSLDAPKPLIERVDPADTGLPQGLALVARDSDYPIETSYWEHRFGLGVGNRLNGVFLRFHATTWAVPSGY